MDLDELILVLSCALRGDLTPLKDLSPARALVLDDALRRAGLYTADLN